MGPLESSSRAGGDRYTLGIEEEVMLLDPINLGLSYQSDACWHGCPRSLARHMSLETHAAVVELATGVHPACATPSPSSARLRARLAAELRAWL